MGIGRNSKLVASHPHELYSFSVPGVENSAVEGTEVAQEGVTSLTVDDVARLQIVNALAFGTGYLLAIASPVHHLQTGTIGTAAIVGPKAVEVGHTHNDADIVAGTQDTGSALLDLRTDHVVLTRRLAVVARHVDMAE